MADHDINGTQHLRMYEIKASGVQRRKNANFHNNNEKAPNTEYCIKYTNISNIYLDILRWVYMFRDPSSREIELP